MNISENKNITEATLLMSSENMSNDTELEFVIETALAYFNNKLSKLADLVDPTKLDEAAELLDTLHYGIKTILSHVITISKNNELLGQEMGKVIAVIDGRITQLEQYNRESEYVRDVIHMMEN